MGFGKKTDFETGRTLDLDKTYKNIIKPAVEAAGLKCIRADDIIHSGPIEVPMYEELLSADVVVADLSTSNRNAFYELGVRHALRPYTTIIICEDGAKTLAFDVRNIRTLPYHHMGEGIDYDEVERFRKELMETIVGVYSKDPRPNDSPVYTFLEKLTPPARAKAIHAVAEAAAESAPRAGQGNTPGGESANGDTRKYSELWDEADAAQKAGDFGEAKSLLKIIRKKMTPPELDDPNAPRQPEAPYIIQRLALVTYKEAEVEAQKVRKQKQSLTPEEERGLNEILHQALTEARGLLETLAPTTSNDTETLGLWGAVHKRLWDETRDAAYLDEAVRGYERGFYLRNDYYNGINLAYLLNVRAAHAPRRAEAVADFVQAERVRREVLSICESALTDSALSADDKYWVLATMAEAYLGVGDEAAARQKFQEASSVASAEWMKDSTQDQMDKLRRLLADSPLKYVKAE
jgi:hypothetical protein